jgi:hypothetical protein
VVAADLVVSGLLDPARAARLERFHAEDRSLPSLDEVVRAMLTRAWGAPGAGAAASDGLRGAVAQGIQTLTVTRLMDLAADGEADPAVRHVAGAALRRLATSLAGRTDAHGAGTRDDIDRFLARPDQPRVRTPVPAAPPGEPIG